MKTTWAFTLFLTTPVLATLHDNETILKLRELSLEELMNIEVSVASKTKDKPLRETPGIVSIITDEEIAQSGARDLIDILRLVPGFDFGIDVTNVVGIGMRGNWVHEGKLLMLIDGIEMNERNYGNLALGNHYPVEHIKRIEIMRGPGAVNYGGFAELGVVNIITKNAEELDGFHVNLTHGQMQNTLARQNLSLMYGKKISKDLEITAMGYVGKGKRSDQEYLDNEGKLLNMATTDQLNPSFINLGLRYGNFSSRFLMDNYRLYSRDSYTELVENPWKIDFKMWAYQAKYHYDFKNNLKLNLEGGYQHDMSWTMDNGNSEELVKNLVEHLWLKNRLNYTLSEQFQIASGIEFYLDKSTDKTLNQKIVPNFQNYTLFLESDYKSTWGNITVGTRYDHHNIFGNALVPRLALTNIIDYFHYKLLYGHSFRTPVASNVYLNPDIQIEKSKVFEAEIGYQIHKNMHLRMNVFNNIINNAITYEVLSTAGGDSYFNSAEKTGTRGIEIEWRFKDKWGNFAFNSSFYQKAYGAAQNQKVINYQTGEEIKSATLAFPTYKTTADATFYLFPQLTLNSSIIFYSSRYGYDGKDENGKPYLRKFSASALTNIFLRYQPTWFKNGEIGVGIYDIFDEKFRFIQPYNGGHNPLPAPSREIIFKIGYKF
jgi:outer membrane cobalamin receptor